MSGKQSKRKRKQQAEQTLPRLDAVYGTTAGNVSSLTVQVDANGEIRILEVDPASLQRRVTHEREGKSEKVIYSAPAKNFTQAQDRWGEVVDRFDYLMAVDTNTLKEVRDGVRFSVCSIFRFSNRLGQLGPDDCAMHVDTYLICDTNADFSASHEPLGWHLAITRNTALLRQNSGRVGLITDHDLGKHVDINAGRIPYYGDAVMPEGVAFLYASSDKADTFANQLIRCCDNAATKVLARVKDRSIAGCFYRDPLEFGSAICFRVRVEPIPKEDRV